MRGPGLGSNSGEQFEDDLDVLYRPGEEDEEDDREQEEEEQ